MPDEPSGRRLTFSQRHGYDALPPQLKVGEISQELRALLWNAVHTDFARLLLGKHYVRGGWAVILKDHHSKVMHRMADDFAYDADLNQKKMRCIFEKESLPIVFDFAEFLLGHEQTTIQLRLEIAKAFIDARSAYRVFDGLTITPVGGEDQAAAIGDAIEAAQASPAKGAATHLLNAGAELRNGNWAGSVRESIHAVEAVAVTLAPGKNTLGDALAVLEHKGHLHGALKSAFQTLYGYASNEAGVRHALVFANEADVDEADALFMLGACASFVSYLISKAAAAGVAA